jgi:hypothetical protein
VVLVREQAKNHRIILLTRFKRRRFRVCDSERLNDGAPPAPVTAAGSKFDFGTPIALFQTTPREQCHLMTCSYMTFAGTGKNFWSTRKSGLQRLRLRPSF